MGCAEALTSGFAGDPDTDRVCGDCPRHSMESPETQRFRAFCVFRRDDPSTGSSTVTGLLGSLTWAFPGGGTVDVYRLLVMRSANRLAAAAPMPGSRCW
jgi:hypothetical protein